MRPRGHRPRSFLKVLLSTASRSELGQRKTLPHPHCVTHTALGCCVLDTCNEDCFVFTSLKRQRLTQPGERLPAPDLDKQVTGRHWNRISSSIIKAFHTGRPQAYFILFHFILFIFNLLLREDRNQPLRRYLTETQTKTLREA